MSTILEDYHIYNRYTNTLIREFTEVTLKALNVKYKKERPELTDDAITAYLEAYEQLKNTPRFINAVNRFYPEVKNPKDIFLFTWEQLEQVIDSLRDIQISANSKIDSTMYKEIYEDDTIKIILGRDPEEWIYIRDTILPTLPPFKGSTWCIGKPGGGNMYYSYRIKKRDGLPDQFWSHYLIHSKVPTPSPRYQNAVLMISDNGQYYLTSQNNADDTTMEWNRVVNLIPALKNKEKYIKFIPLSVKEEEEYAVTKAKPEDFDKLKYRPKMIYCQIGKPVFIKDFINMDKELQTMYVNGRFDRGGFSLYGIGVYETYSKNLFAKSKNDDSIQGDIQSPKFIERLSSLLGDVSIGERFNIYKELLLYISPELKNFPQVIQTFSKQCEKYLPALKSKLLSNIIAEYNVKNFKTLTDAVKYTLCELPQIFITSSDFVNLPVKSQINYINSRKTLRHLVYLFFTPKMLRAIDSLKPEQNKEKQITDIWKNNSVIYRQVIDMATRQGQREKGKGITYLLNFNNLSGDLPIRKEYTSKILEKIKEENE